MDDEKTMQELDESEQLPEEYDEKEEKEDMPKWAKMILDKLEGLTPSNSEAVKTVEVPIPPEPEPEPEEESFPMTEPEQEKEQPKKKRSFLEFLM